MGHMDFNDGVHTRNSIVAVPVSVPLNFGADRRSLLNGTNLQPFRAATYIFTVFLVLEKNHENI